MLKSKLKWLLKRLMKQIIIEFNSKIPKSTKKTRPLLKKMRYRKLKKILKINLLVVVLLGFLTHCLLQSVFPFAM